MFVFFLGFLRFSLDFLRFPMVFPGGTSAWRPMMMRRRATRSQATPVRAARGPKPGPFWLGKRWDVTNMMVLPRKMMVLPRKMMILPRKMMVLPRKMMVLPCKIMGFIRETDGFTCFTRKNDDFGELWWFCQGTLLDFNENEKNDDFTRGPW